MQREQIEGSSARRTLGLILIILPATALGASAIAKFAGVPGVVQPMAAAGFGGPKLILIATLEAVSATLFLFPRSRSIGLLFLSAFLGGAICVHVQMGEYSKALPASLLLVLAWAGTSLRHPQILWSLTRTDGMSTARAGHEHTSKKEA